MFTPNKTNIFLLFNLPSAFFSGVRVVEIDEFHSKVKVRHNWFNKNPFRSMYFAVQAMAAELSTGVLVMNAIKKSIENISMLVVSNESTFLKKATGTIIFTCNEGKEVQYTIQKVLQTGQPQTIWMESVGVNQKGEVVSKMRFEWALKIKK